MLTSGSGARVRRASGCDGRSCLPALAATEPPLSTNRFDGPEAYGYGRQRHRAAPSVSMAFVRSVYSCAHAVVARFDVSDGPYQAPRFTGRAEGLDVPGFTHLERIGRGGFSIVFRAYQQRLSRWVALKVLLVDHIDGKTEQRFLRECAAAGRLSDHPNIVTVYDSGITTDGLPFIAMEYVRTGTMADRLNAEGPLPVADVLDIAFKIAGALEAAHSEGIVHRDVKPQNIMQSAYGEPLLADFGIATLVETSSISRTSSSFTPGHVAPEVLQGHRAGPACDVYSLGSSMYHLLTGQPAFLREGDESYVPILYRAIHEPVPRIERADVSDPVQRAIEWAMAKDPAHRPVSAAAFAEHVYAVQQAEGLVLLRRATPLPSARLPEPPSVTDESTVASAQFAAADDPEVTRVRQAHVPGAGGETTHTASHTSPGAQPVRAPEAEPAAGRDTGRDGQEAEPSEVKAAKPDIVRSSRSRRWIGIGVGAMVGLLFLILLAVVLMSRSQGSVGPSTSISASATIEEVLPPKPPTGLTVGRAPEDPTVVEARWTPGDEPGIEVLFWWKGTPPGSVPPKPSFFPAPSTPGFLRATALEASTAYCFAVSPVGETNEGAAITSNVACVEPAGP